MRAIVIPRFGGPEVLEVRDVPTPEPGLGEVTVDVAYAGVNYAEVLYRRGVVDVPLPFVPGIEVAGHIRTLGPGVAGLRVGEPVAALTIVDSGGYAEVARVAAALTFPLDTLAPGLDLATAAAFPSNTTTAMLVLSAVAHLRRGERALIHGATGGVGSVLGQVARALGAGQVLGTVGSAAKMDAAAGYGYDTVLLSEGFADALADATGGAGVDVVVDPVGGAARRQSLAALNTLGRLVAMGNASDAADVPVSANDLWFSGRAVLGFNLALLSARAPGRVRAAAEEALRLVARGEVRVDVSGVLPLDQAAEAHRRIEERAVRGKLVLHLGADYTRQ